MPKRPSSLHPAGVNRAAASDARQGTLSDPSSIREQLRLNHLRPSHVPELAAEVASRLAAEGRFEEAEDCLTVRDPSAVKRE